MECKTRADIGEIVAMFSPNFMAEGREFHEEFDRDLHWASETEPANGPRRK